MGGEQLKSYSLGYYRGKTGGFSCNNAEQPKAAPLTIKKCRSLEALLYGHVGF